MISEHGVQVRVEAADEEILRIGSREHYRAASGAIEGDACAINYTDCTTASDDKEGDRAKEVCEGASCSNSIT